jgi:hypothetical protein
MYARIIRGCLRLNLVFRCRDLETGITLYCTECETPNFSPRQHAAQNRASGAPQLPQRGKMVTFKLQAPGLEVTKLSRELQFPRLCKRGKHRYPPFRLIPLLVILGDGGRILQAVELAFVLPLFLLTIVELFVMVGHRPSPARLLEARTLRHRPQP